MKFLVTAHLGGLPPSQRAGESRSASEYPGLPAGRPVEGYSRPRSGAIFPVPEADITVTDFELAGSLASSLWLDVGWNRTAAIWGALNRETRPYICTRSTTAAKRSR